MPLLGNQKLDEYAVVLTRSTINGEETWTEYVYAPNIEHAAWAGLELSKDRQSTLKDVMRTDEW